MEAEALTKSHWISDLKWLRACQQTRSQRTRAALLDAAETLFSEHGVDAASVAEIASLAGCSVGSVYHHFRDKTALLHAIMDRLASESQSAIAMAISADRWKGAPICAILQGYLEFSLEVAHTRPGLRVMDMPEVRQAGFIADRIIAVKQEMQDGFYRLLHDRRDEIGHSNPDLAIRLVLDLLVGMLKNRANAFPYPLQLADTPDDIFVTEVVRAASAYLQLKKNVQRPSPGPDGI
ncbi:hypothetical protein P775_05895 [Puniceibacterium antarcticum]|uniref:HTH tetR-type domain-containing protein n=1 Tax=Puniceibacterium antarcticum TaxID=1206336 RepID=A0A2G8RHN2_9RHOB|nr:TetR/AcrR family transcriptional regulator [Puniceibacterium antarcticum]PIL21075.1 hypothetical protein P775_05895 [Puniceibacterium antarcticum]